MELRGLGGECHTVSQLSALSASLEQLISVMRSQAVSRQVSGDMVNHVAGVWSAISAYPKSIPQSSFGLTKESSIDIQEGM